MKRVWLGLLLIFSFLGYGQNYVYRVNRFIAYNEQVISIQDTQQSYNFYPYLKNISGALNGLNYWYLADSTNVYFFSKGGDSLVKSFSIGWGPVGTIRLFWVMRPDTSVDVVYAIVGLQGDVWKVYKFYDTALVDSGTIYNVFPVYEIYQVYDTLAYVFGYKTVDFGTYTLINLRVFSFNYDSLVRVRDYYVKVTEPYFAPPYYGLKMSNDLNYVAFLSGAGIVIARYNAGVDTLDYSILPIAGLTGDFSPKGRYFYFSSGSKFFRYGIFNGQLDTLQFIDLNTNVELIPKSIVRTYGGFMLISYVQDIVTGGIIYNADDSVLRYFYETGFYFGPSYGYKALYVIYPQPYFDIEGQKIGNALFNLYLSYSAFNREPDTIYWRLFNSKVIDTTVAGSHTIDVQLISEGDYTIYAKGIFYNVVDNSVDSVVISYSFYNPDYLYPQLFLEDSLLVCDTPSYFVDFSKYTLYSDSVVWYKNGLVFLPFKNKSRLTIREPGRYKAIVYNPTEYIEDSIVIQYIDKSLSRKDWTLFINGIEHTEQSVYCTDNGVLNFRLVANKQPFCQENYKIVWYFGDGSPPQSTDNLFVSHRYLQPGFYTVFIWIFNTKTLASYFIYTNLNVSINPIEQVPDFINVPKLTVKELYLNKDIVIRRYRWKAKNAFLNYVAGGVSFDTLSIHINVMDSAYQQIKPKVTVFLAGAMDKAQNLRMTLVNPFGQSAVVLDEDEHNFPNVYAMLGRPKFMFADPDIYPESYYPYFWNDTMTATLYAYANSIPVDNQYFYFYPVHMEDFNTYRIANMWLAPTGLKPKQPLAIFSDTTAYGEWILGFKILQDTSIIHHLTVDVAGIILSPYTYPGKYNFQIYTDAALRQVNDTTFLVGYDIPGRYNITVKVEDHMRCVYKKDIPLYILDTVVVSLPNTFTPNGDGYNDGWDLRRAFFVELMLEKIPVYVKIWDRKGRVVIEYLANDMPVWDGRDKEGRLVAPGTYWYLIIVGNKKYYRGSVTVIY